MLKFVGAACILFGILDLLMFYVVKVDITGFALSPYLALLVGWVILSVGGGRDDD